VAQQESKEAAKSATKDIWTEDEVPDPDDTLDRDPHDKRKRPEFDILFKQAVGSETVYFGMGDKDPSTNSCSHLVVRIKFPGEKGKDLDLDVAKQKLTAQSLN
jgi:hypothetical protein